MSRRDYLTTADVLAMHAALIRRYGGTGGLRDAGALDSALHRPRTGYYPDVVAEAAALLESLAMNHPFTDVFLRINGWRLDRAPGRIHAELIAMFESGTFD